MTPPSGAYAEVTPFANVRRSGTTPNSSLPNHAPRRPKPLITSSAHSSTPYLSQMRRKLGPVAVGRHERAAPVLHRLGDHHRDGLRPLLEDLVLDRAHALQAPVQRVGHVPHAVPEHREEGRAQPRHRGDRERAKGRAVVRPLAGDDLVPALVAPGDVVVASELRRGLDCLGAGADEEHVLEIAGREVGDECRGLDRGRAHDPPVRRERERLHLLGGHRAEVGTTVPDLHAEEAAQAVEHLAPGVVPQVGTVAAHVHGELGALPRLGLGEVRDEVTASSVADVAHVLNPRSRGPCTASIGSCRSPKYPSAYAPRRYPISFARSSSIVRATSGGQARYWFSSCRSHESV